MYIITIQYNTPVPTYRRAGKLVALFHEMQTATQTLMRKPPDFDDLQYILNMYSTSILNLHTAQNKNYLTKAGQDIYTGTCKLCIQKSGIFSKHTIFLSISMYIYKHCKYIFHPYFHILFFNCVYVYHAK